jgi:hypothetical protein
MSRAIIVLYIEPSPVASAPAVEKWRTQILKSIPSDNWIRKVVASDKISDSQPYRVQFIVDVDNLKDTTEEVIQSLRSDASDIIAHSEWHIYREISRNFRQGL